MSDFKDKAEQKIDDAAHAAKRATDKAVDTSKEAAYQVGKVVERTGEDIKEQGK